MRILYVTTISLTMNTFFQPHIEMLVNEGHEVDIACNFNDLPLAEGYELLQCKKYQIDFSRSPLSFENVKAYGQLKKVIEEGAYDVVHCHTPNASVITRLVCRKLREHNGVKVFYTAHGFHFYKGAPIKNWIEYYPIELLCSIFTDKLITINFEDYAFAKQRMLAKEVYYIPGVGVDISRMNNTMINVSEKKENLEIPSESIILLSVGELNQNKNHVTVIKALAELDNTNIHYIIAGNGNLKNELQELCKELNLENRVHLLGYREDVDELYRISDIFVFPSIREGLSVALMEAMASSLPCVVSKIRGNVDLIDEKGGMLFEPLSIEACKDAIQTIIAQTSKKFGGYNKEKIKQFSREVVNEKIYRIYVERKEL